MCALTHESNVCENIQNEYKNIEVGRRFIELFAYVHCTVYVHYIQYITAVKISKNYETSYFKNS